MVDEGELAAWRFPPGPRGPSTMLKESTSPAGSSAEAPPGPATPAWSETYLGGSPEAERAVFERLARDVMKVQLRTRKAAGAHGVPHAVDRAFHAKATLAADDAELRFLDLPEDLRTGFAQPGAAYPVAVRFSNAAGKTQPDLVPDLRGVALRIIVSPDEQHDLLATNYPVSHARDAGQFVRFAVATAGDRLSQVAGLLRLAITDGPSETQRMLGNIQAGRRRKVLSVATETYWSRGAIAWGDGLAVRYLLRPAPGTPPGSEPAWNDPDHLAHEAARRLAAGPMRFELCVQRFRDEATTPIEDTAVSWTPRDTPVEPVAILTVRARAEPAALNGLDFNPWNTTDGFRPLGNLNRARKAAYDASAAHRRQLRWQGETPVRNVVVGAAVGSALKLVNRFVPWHRLGVRLGLLNLQVLRQDLRRANLIDTEPREAPPAARPVPAAPDETARVWRTYDGTSNDLSDPRMGSVGSTFGRNLRADYRADLFDEPNPIVVSRELLYRETFRPAPSMNLLAAAWIQFQVHDWVNHARHPLGRNDVVVPLPPGMPGWSNTPGGAPEPRMRIAGNIAQGPAGPDGTERLFSNAASHWWDGSEVYGGDKAGADALRDGAKLRLTAGGHLPQDLNGQEVTGFNESWWLGLSGLHTLFAREHNVICDELRSHYRGWNDERVYQTARLIVSALIAKIHTVEWTPAILGTETIDVGLKSNWNGPPAHDWMTRLGMWLVDQHANTGIPGTMPDHHAAPYSLTEDFVTVYRMHPLLPDEYVYRDHRTNEILDRRGFLQIQGNAADDELRALGLENMLYSFGLSHPGAITLHNYPRALQELERDGERIDLSVVDLVRTRRRGIPRYNDFRAGLHKPRLERWEDLCADPESVRRLREVYRDIDEVDTMVGLFAETPPEGFGFSDTAFRVFILMASRRLQSDRFLTVDFRPEIYSPFGLDWIANNGMTSVIQRHCPDLAAVLPRDASAFAPWRPVPEPPARGGSGAK
ncbi:peroxidase family protein [Actinoplanes sp. NPDC000266]